MPDPTTTGTAEAEAPEGEPQGRTPAEQILYRAIERWKAEADRDTYLRDKLRNEQTGEPGAGYRGVLLENLGEFNLQYGPLATVERLFAELQATFEGMSATIGPLTVPLSEVIPDEEVRRRLLLDTVQAAAYFLIAGAGVEVTHALRRNYELSLQYAVAAMQSTISKLMLSNPALTDVRINAKEAVEHTVKKHAAEERERMLTMMASIPHVFTRANTGRAAVWTAQSLRRTLIDGLRQLPPERRSIRELYEWLAQNTAHPPKNAAALKQLIHDKGLKFTDLKRAAARPVRKLLR